MVNSLPTYETTTRNIRHQPPGSMINTLKWSFSSPNMRSVIKILANSEDCTYNMSLLHAIYVLTIIQTLVNVHIIYQEKQQQMQRLHTFSSGNENIVVYITLLIRLLDWCETILFPKMWYRCFHSICNIKIIFNVNAQPTNNNSETSLTAC